MSIAIGTQYRKDYEAKEADTRIDARVERQAARNGDDDAELGLYIRISDSSIYEWKPTLKSLLLAICYLRVNGEALFDRPKARRGPKISYTGWCYASEKRLAQRVGCAERTVRRGIRTLREDGVILVRTWRDKAGRLHNEYFIVEEVIARFEREDGAPREKCQWQRREPNASWFSKDNQPHRKVAQPCASLHKDEAIGQIVREPQVNSSIGHRSDGRQAIGQMARTPTDELSVEVGFGVGVGLRGVKSTSNENDPPAAPPLNGGCENRHFVTAPASQENQPQPQKQHQPHGGFAPKPPADASRPVPPPAAAQPPSPWADLLKVETKAHVPRRGDYQSRLEYCKACCREGLFPDREPGLPVPLRSDHKTRFGYVYACWEAGVPPDTEEGVPTTHVFSSPPSPEDYCPECGLDASGLDDGANECKCNRPPKTAAAAARGPETVEELD